MLPFNHRLFTLGLVLAATIGAARVGAIPADRGAEEPGLGGKGQPAGASGRNPGASLMTGDEWRFLDLLNRERAARHLTELKPDPLLVEVARAHSREMYEKNYFDHVSPTPGERTPMDRYLHALHHRPAHACVGENLFYCSIVDVERGHRALMNSPGHRGNILYAPFRRGGIGIYKSENGEFWVTEMFLTTEG
jgi:uncharacterized protein YkwD